MKTKAKEKRRGGRILKWLLIVAAAIVLIPILEVGAVRFINPPMTMPMLLRKVARTFSQSRHTPEKYEWINREHIPITFLRHLWISEDQRFFEHDGFDWKEMDIAIKDAERKGKPARGASTITMQCARSLFLWQGRSWIRKGLEAYYTVLMEWLLPKQRILELYANVIEMGDGIYGVQAAAKHFYDTSAEGLTRQQSAMLVALLPNPIGWNPTKPASKLLQRQQRILQREKTARLPVSLLR